MKYTHLACVALATLSLAGPVAAESSDGGCVTSRGPYGQPLTYCPPHPLDVAQPDQRQEASSSSSSNDDAALGAAVLVVGGAVVVGALIGLIAHGVHEAKIRQGAAYAQFYKPATTTIARPTPGVKTELRSGTGNFRRDVEEMYAQGFGSIGASNFVGPLEGVRGALAEGEKIGATYAQVTTKSMSTEGAPRYQQTAIYYAPIPRTGLGAWRRLPTDDEARALGTARMEVVRAIRAGSPAYNADILPGDEIIAVNGSPFGDPAMLKAATDTGKVHLTLNRAGQTIEKDITVPAAW